MSKIYISLCRSKKQNVARGVEKKLVLRKKKDENLSCWDHIDRNCKIFGGKDDADFKKKMVR